MKSIGDILRGDSSNEGLRHVTSGGASITKGPTEDPNFPGGSYLSVSRRDGGKQTVVFDSSGQPAKTIPNSRW